MNNSLKIYKFKTKWFGFVAIKGDDGPEFGSKGFKFADLLWLTSDHILLHGPGLHFRAFGWVVRMGIFTNMERL